METIRGNSQRNVCTHPDLNPPVHVPVPQGTYSDEASLPSLVSPLLPRDQNRTHRQCSEYCKFHHRASRDVPRDQYFTTRKYQSSRERPRGRCPRRLKQRRFGGRSRNKKRRGYNHRNRRRHRWRTQPTCSRDTAYYMEATKLDKYLHHAAMDDMLDVCENDRIYMCAPSTTFDSNTFLGDAGAYGWK